MPNRPHLAWPPRITPTGRYATTEQDSPDHVTQRVALVLSVVKGSLIDRPTFGIPAQAFTQAGIGLEDLRNHIDQWVPAAHATVDDTALINLARTIGVTVHLQGADVA